MVSPERFSSLPEPVFPRLRNLLAPHAPGHPDPVTMTIGEPRHPMPPFVAEVLAASAADLAFYPVNEGSPALLEAIAAWLRRRYGVTVATDAILALNGTREGLFAAALALCPETVRDKRPVILIPNPFYQVYAAAALAAGAEPVFVPATEATGHLPDYVALPDDVLNRVALAYVCSPSNPQGAVAGLGWWADLLALADRYDFRILSDECYAEIWRTAPPHGGLEAVAAAGADPERVLVFHSLSKRSNLPGLRSGFVAGGAQGIAAMRRLRAHAGAPLPGPVQALSAAVWADESHVIASRELYQDKFRAADAVFAALPGFTPPEGGFFLWLPVPDDEAAAIRAWREAGVRVLPGAYLGRAVAGHNPGSGYIRVALVAPIEEMQRGLTRLADCLYG